VSISDANVFFITSPLSFFLIVPDA